MFTEELKKVVEQGKLPKVVAEKYLAIYLGDSNWGRHWDTLVGRLQKKYSGTELGDAVKRQIGCAILLPSTNKGVHVDSAHPENLLFQCASFHQFHDQDWFKELQEVISRDLQIQEWRNQALSLGVVDPLEYAPYCRQAFNWLYGKAEDSGHVTAETKEDIVRRCKNIVWAYGGACITNIFLRHEEDLKKVANWRTGYFFERVIFDVYTPDQVLKIKKADLDKTNSRLIKKIRID